MFLTFEMKIENDDIAPRTALDKPRVLKSASHSASASSSQSLVTATGVIGSQILRNCYHRLLCEITFKQNKPLWICESARLAIMDEIAPEYDIVVLGTGIPGKPLQRKLRD